MKLAPGIKVRHKTDRALGIGEVGFIQEQVGVLKAIVRWPARPGTLLEHTDHELEVVEAIVDRLGPDKVGQASFQPFLLRVLARWFEARHALTGELSNQPFQMLPHQVIVTNRVVNSAADGRRWLIADDVGLGKTIEAGMIMEVLRKHCLGRFRCLVVAPAGLKRQWQEEMERRFSRHFRLFDSRYANELEESDALIASIDTLKLKRLDAALQTVSPWELVIFDEAHHLATETYVQKYDLARRLHERGLARNTLFLTATPHSGNIEHFYNMLRLLRPDLFTAKSDVARNDGRLNQVMLRNRKSEVTDADGELIFRGIVPAQILKCEPSLQEVAFYEELLRFVRRGYGVAKTLKRARKDTTTGNAVGFLMATFRKLASSSRAAIRTALENRQRALEEADDAVANVEDGDERYQGEAEEREVTTAALKRSGRAKGKVKSPIKDELASIRELLRLLADIDHPDSKLSFFVNELRKLPASEKGLIFTEYRGTQRALVEALEEAFGEAAVGIVHGSMSLDQRQQEVETFNTEPTRRFLVSTEAGGEGLNMQRACHIVFNYDLPWNPVRLQQRIGRVYRYGQSRAVQVYNVRLDSDSDAFADGRVDEYLRKKIQDITRALAEVQGGKPEDLENDVLGQVAESMSLDELYEQAATEGYDKAKRTIDQQSAQLQRILEDPEGTLGLFKGLKSFDITDYQKAAARVPDEAIESFVRQYLARHGEAYERTAAQLYGFGIPKTLKDVASRIQKSDPHEARRDVAEKRVANVTVSKTVARKTNGSRLLRFGDPIFDAMVRHVQDSDFSEGVASLQIPADVVGWTSGTRGTLTVFDLKVMRQEGTLGGTRVLREDLVAIAVPAGGTPNQADHLLEQLHQALPGNLDIDVAEVRRAYELARADAKSRLRSLYEGCVNEFGTDEAIVPQDEDFAMAWVEAV